MKILIVEDDEEISSLMCEYLQDEGYDVSVASNGLMALERLRDDGIPNLILLDMMMPVMDGTEFTKKFRKMYQNVCPIVVMSAAVDVEKRASEIDAVAWLSKPLTLEKIDLIVKKHAIQTHS